MALLDQSISEHYHALYVYTVSQWHIIHTHHDIHVLVIITVSLLQLDCIVSQMVELKGRPKNIELDIKVAKNQWQFSIANSEFRSMV